ncbi:MAG: hemolysin family protein [Oscillospiraceae bacterium]|jgi:putative hemolysin|nr:hemolysin family protein [Oscillospiraceae bacterium]
MSGIVSLIVLLLLTLLNAFFAMSEIAIITLNDAKIERMAGGGHKGAMKIELLTANSSSFLATIQVGVTFAGFLSSASAATSFAGDFGALLSKLSFMSDAAAKTAATVIITLLLAFFNLVFGELVPKKIGMQKAESISFAVGGTLLFIKRAFTPFVWLLTVSTNGISRLIGIDPNKEESTVTEEEILMMVDVGGQKGVIEQSEREMIENIFEFDDTTASEIMSHRTEIVGVENTDDIMTITQSAIETGYSRIPVYEGDIDTIVGIIYVKDLLKYVGTTDIDDISIGDLMREPYYIPEGKKLSSLFSEMTAKKIQMAVVVDEYGGTAGVVTMEDLIESIFGSIQDEYDNEEEEISQVSDNCFTVDGATSVDEVSELIGEQIPDGDYDTVAGYIVSVIGRIPARGDRPSVNVGKSTLTVELVEDRRISKVLVVKGGADTNI